MHWRAGGKGQVVCWDLDENIGSFRDYSDMRIMRGIRPLLERISLSGAQNVITTAASLEHAEYVLNYFALRQHFAEIFHRDIICDSNYNKYYSPVAQRLGIDMREAEHRMVVIGNLTRDSPADLDLVFFYHPFGFHYDSRVPESVLSMLSRPEASWSESFSLLMAQPGQAVLEPWFRGKFVSGSNPSFALGYARLGKPQPAFGNRMVTYSNLPGDYLVYPLPTPSSEKAA
jgi:hypothetical protein